MAIFHLSVKTISRSAGRSATAAAAYRSGACIADARTGEIHDYTRKHGVISSKLFLPYGSPTWAKDREQLWNAVEKAETRKNSTVAREFEIALPAELSPRQRERLAHFFTRDLVNKYGFAAECAIHEPGKGGDSKNYHAHILCSTRKLTAEGFTSKTRELDDRATGAVQVVECRELFAKMANWELDIAGSSARIDHRSLAAQGIDRAPSAHLGVVATAIERRGETSQITERERAKVAERVADEKAAEAIQLANVQDVARIENELVVAIELLRTEKVKEKEDDRVRNEAFERIGRNVHATRTTSQATYRAIEATDRAIEAAGANLGSAIQGAERRQHNDQARQLVETFGERFQRVIEAIRAIPARVVALKARHEALERIGRNIQATRTTSQATDRAIEATNRAINAAGADLGSAIEGVERRQHNRHAKVVAQTFGDRFGLVVAAIEGIPAQVVAFLRHQKALQAAKDLDPSPSPLTAAEEGFMASKKWVQTKDTPPNGWLLRQAVGRVGYYQRSTTGNVCFVVHSKDITLSPTIDSGRGR